MNRREVQGCFREFNNEMDQNGESQRQLLLIRWKEENRPDMLEFRFVAQRTGEQDVHVYGSIFFNSTENEPDLIDIVECIEAYTTRFEFKIKLDYDVDLYQGVK